MFEPVYLIETDAAGATSIREKLFNVYSPDLGTSFKNALVDIRSDMLKCAPYNSKPADVYQYVRNVPFTAIINAIKDKKDFVIKHQVTNYNNKTIGAIVSYNSGEKEGYVPCEPSYIHSLYEIKTMDDNIYAEYEKTRDFLKFIKKTLKLPCKPLMKVIEDEEIVGILTETNQVVPISKPTENISFDVDNLEVKTFGTDIRVADALIASSSPDEQDEKRKNAIKRIRLETNFYNTFRNTVRILLSKYENRNLKKKINDVIDEPNIYMNKLTLLNELIHELVEGHVEFIHYKVKDIEKLEKVLTCGKDCGGEKKSYCITKDNKKCTLLIPNKHLLSEKNNETIYFNRIADEMLRYKQIREYLFTEGTFLIIEQLDYDLHKDEIVLLHDLLFNEYIESGEMPMSNPYIKHNTHETAQPSERVLYMEDKQQSDRKKASAPSAAAQQPVRKESDVPELCQVSTGELGAKHKLYKFFHNKSKPRYLTKHEGNVNCGYELLAKIITDFTGKPIDTSQIKKLLIDLFTKDSKNMDKYLNTMSQQGKKDIVETMSAKKTTLNMLMAADNYYISNIDIYLIAKHFKLPIIIMSSTRLRENGQALMTMNYDENNAFYYLIQQHAPINNIVQRYSLLQTDTQSIRIDVSDFTPLVKTSIKNNDMEDGFIYTIRIKPTRASSNE